MLGCEVAQGLVGPVGVVVVFELREGRGEFGHGGLDVAVPVKLVPKRALKPLDSAIQLRGVGGKDIQRDAFLLAVGFEFSFELAASVDLDRSLISILNFGPL